MASKLSIEAQFQRDLNRCHDSDRTTRKKGLEKLLESLPWEKKSTTRKELLTFLFHQFSLVLSLIPLKNVVSIVCASSNKLLEYGSTMSKCHPSF